MKKELTNGDYLRCLERTLGEFDIDWFNIGVNATTIRGLYKEGGKWFIKDYLGFREDKEKINDILDLLDNNMEDICRKVIDYVSYDEDEKCRLTEYFNHLVAYDKSKLGNTSVISFVEKAYKEKGIQIPKVYYHEMFEDIKGHLSGYQTIEAVSDLYNRIKPCSCGGKVELHGLAGMGEIDYIIKCKECTKMLSRGIYDACTPYPDEDKILDALTEDWNNGVEQYEIDRLNSSELSRIAIKPSDLIWKEYYPNNMISNGVEGLYSLVFCKNRSGKLYCCKWTIEYQLEELEPMHIRSDARIEAYNLFMERFFEIKGLLRYPEPLKKYSGEEDEKDYETFGSYGVNDKGEFIRSYRTLEEAKAGAVGRCGWQGINRDTLIKVETFGDITAEELEKEDDVMTWKEMWERQRKYDLEHNNPELTMDKINQYIDEVRKGKTNS
ncbi:MAG: hypothetical protein K6E10_12295 [Eubacterium sp.]|nr:hypothetical protein [Eubacterium sp.]